MNKRVNTDKHKNNTFSYIFWNVLSYIFSKLFVDIRCFGNKNLKLLYFRGKPDGEEGELTWSTATELNNDYFIVERSSNGVDFYPIFEVDGVGTTKQRTNYLEYDTEPLSGKSYYRLKARYAK